MLGLVITNDWHGLVWPSIQISATAPHLALVYQHGLAFWVHTFYSYTLLLIGTGRLIYFAFRSQQSIPPAGNITGRCSDNSHIK